ARRVDLRGRVRLTAVVREADPDRVVITVRAAVPNRGSGMPCAAVFGHQAIDRAGAADEVMIGYLRLPPAQPVEVSRIGAPGRAMDDNEVGSRASGARA